MYQSLVHFFVNRCRRKNIYYQIFPKRNFLFSLENMIIHFKNIRSAREKITLKNIFVDTFNYKYLIDSLRHANN